MNKVVFSSWDGTIVDNRGLEPDRYAGVALEFPLERNGYQMRAFMSWNGLVVADEKVNVIDLAYNYLKEVQKLSCGACSVGYLGVKVLTDLVGKLANGRGTAEDIDAMVRLTSGMKDNTRCDFCSLSITPIIHTLKYYRDDCLKLATTGEKALPRLRYSVRVTAPCMEACPAHQDAPGYIELNRNHRFSESLELIRRTNCLPGTIGRACVAFCEENCVRADIDSPIAIRALKRVPADYEVVNNLSPKLEKRPNSPVKVAVIGAGPAGLAASYNLALMGYKVTLYDEQATAGGMALLGIPPYRLPKDVLGRESDIIRSLGIEFKPKTRLGRDVSLEQLSAEGFKAVFIATGAHKDRESDIDNWNKSYDGLAEGIEFLRDVNLGKDIKPKNKVIIVGGGNVAIDCARTCVRLGCKDVNILYRRSRTEMPARKDEVEEAEREGAKISFQVVPVKALNQGNKVTGAECIRMELGAPDASGRRRPIPVKGSEFTVEADMIISAIGEMPDLSFVKSKTIQITDQGTIAADPVTLQTNLPWLFSGGDCVLGPSTLVECISTGNRVARSIAQYLQTGKVTLTKDDIVEGWLHNVALSHKRDGGVIPKKVRQSPRLLAVADRRRGFGEVEQALTLDEATREADRCLRCYRVMLMAIGK